MTGTSLACGQQAVIEELREKACSEGADAVQIYKIKRPDLASTCYRMSATFFTKALKIVQSLPEQTTSQIPPSVKLPAKINAAKGSPEIHFDEFIISPERIKVGDKFQLTVKYTASDPRKPNESIPITFFYKLIKDGEVLFKSKTKSIQSPNNQSAFALKKLNIKAKKKGEYQIRVYLYYGKSAGKMSKKTFVIE